MPNIFRIFVDEDKSTFVDASWFVARCWMSSNRNVFWFIELMMIIGCLTVADELHAAAENMTSSCSWHNHFDPTEFSFSDEAREELQSSGILPLFTGWFPTHRYELVPTFAQKVGRFIVLKNGDELQVLTSWGGAPTFMECLNAFQSLGILQAILEAPIPAGTRGFLSDMCTGMSGRKDWYFINSHSLGSREWGYGRRILHLSMYGKLNEGVKCCIWQLGMLLRRDFLSECRSLIVRKDENGEIQFNQPDGSDRDLLIPVHSGTCHYFEKKFFSKDDWLDEPIKAERPRKNRPVEE